MVKYWMFRRKSMEAAGQRADSSSSNGGSPLNRSPKVRSDGGSPFNRSPKVRHSTWIVFTIYDNEAYIRVREGNFQGTS